MNPLTASLDDILRADAFELFGILSFESLPQILERQGRLSEATVQAVDRSARKFALRLHPDKNQGSEAFRSAFEHVRKMCDFAKNPAEMLAHVQRTLGATQQETKRADGMSRALAAGAKLAQDIAAKRELRRQQEARAAAELQANLSRMRSGDAASSSSSSLSSASALGGGGRSNKEAVQAQQREILTRERRKQMTEWERLEEEMLDDWDVDAGMLGRKQADMRGAMRWLEAKHNKSGAALAAAADGSALAVAADGAASAESAAEAKRAADVAALVAKLGGGGGFTLPNRRNRPL